MATVSLAEAARPLVLALDIGTSSTRALLFDARAVAIEGTECQLTYELRATPDGGAEVDAPFLFDLVCQSIDGTLSAAGDLAQEIAVVGVSCFWHSLLVLDGDGEPLTPVLLWADTRSRDEVAALRRETRELAVWRRTGCYLHSSYWPGKLRWLQVTQPETLKRAKRLCAFSDYVARRLVGTDVTTVSMASGTGLLNQRQTYWDQETLKLVGIDPDLLPSLVDTQPAEGGLSRELRERWPALSQARWCPGIGDGACANLGSGGTGPNRIALTIGTSGAMRMVRRMPAEDAPETPQVLWTYRVDTERAVIGAAVSNGGNVPAWLGELLGVGFDDEEIEVAGLMEPNSHGLTVLPFLAGERAPIWNDSVTGVIAGLTLSTDKPAILRAGVEAVCYRFRMLYDGLREVAATPHEIIANGGAILRSPSWLQAMADVLEHEVLALPPDEEASAKGAAMLALEAAGINGSLEELANPVASATRFEPNPAASARYAAGLERHLLLESHLFPRGRRWDE